jgi:8-oxo-dGTP pyrophosphatase MutT (NUDIX family)
MLKPTKITAEVEVARDRDRSATIRATVETPDGRSHEWVYSKTPDAVIVLAFDAAGRLAVKREWRLGRKDFTWELPSGWAGSLDRPVAPAEAAERELREEVGVTGQLRKIGEFFQSNHATTKFHVFVAEQLREAPLPPDEDEHVESCFLPLDAARERLLREQTPAAQVLCAVAVFDADANRRRR